MKKIVILFAVILMVISSSATEPEKKKTAKPIELTKADFQEKIFDYEKKPGKWLYNGDKPAIVEFHADWCGPCRIVAPILKDLAAEYADQIYIYKINVDKEGELAAMFGARSIPMFLFIPMDGEPQMGRGALPRKSFLEVIDTFLLKKKDQDNLPEK